MPREQLLEEEGPPPHPGGLSPILWLCPSHHGWIGAGEETFA